MSRDTWQHAQGLASVCFVGILVTLRICWAVYYTQDHKSGKSDKAPGKPVHKPRLVRVHQTLGFSATIFCNSRYISQDHKSGKSGNVPGKPAHWPCLVCMRAKLMPTCCCTSLHVHVL